jgi:hypothetical protein
VIREGVATDGRLRDEPHFESMIFTDVGSRLSVRQNSIVDAEAAEEGGIDENEEIDLRSIYKGLDPVNLLVSRLYNCFYSGLSVLCRIFL